MNLETFIFTQKVCIESISKTTYNLTLQYNILSIFAAAQGNQFSDPRRSKHNYSFI